MEQGLLRVVGAGVLATGAMTALMVMAPSMGMPEMNIGAMLGSMMGGSLVLGWMAHVVIGVGLAIAYANVSAHLPVGSVAARGALSALAPWAMAQLVVMPMMGAGLFGGSALAAAGSLMGHLLYGAVLGVTVGEASARSAAAVVAA